MTDPLATVLGRRGHFRMESGLHGDLWLDLDGLFADPSGLAPAIGKLAERLKWYGVAAVCGPLVGGAFLAQRLAESLGIGFAYTERVATTSGDALYGARYRLPESFVERLRGRRVALVDDVMSAGSSLRATHRALVALQVEPVVVATLAVLGSRGSDFFAGIGLPVETLSRRPCDAWAPADCPQCRAGVALERVG